MSYEQHEIVICGGNCYTIGGSADGGVVYLDKWGRMPDSVMLIEPSRYPDVQGVMGWAEGVLADYGGLALCDGSCLLRRCHGGRACMITESAARLRRDGVDKSLVP